MRQLNLRVANEDEIHHGQRQSPAASPFELSGQAIRTVAIEENPDQLAQVWDALLAEAQTRKAEASVRKHLSPLEIEAIAREVFESHTASNLAIGRHVPKALLTRLIGELSGLGDLLSLIASNEVEDIAINLNHIYVYRTNSGWQKHGRSTAGLGDAIRVLMDRAGQRTPTPDFPISDAMLQVMVPDETGEVVRKGLRVSYIMPPASPYGDMITLRVSRYATGASSGLDQLCRSRLPPVIRPEFYPAEFAHGDGLLTPAAANYLLSVMVHGGTLIVAGTTGSGKTFIAQRILEEMLRFYPDGAIRLFVIEDANELVLNGWNGDPGTDTGNVVYTVTRGEIRGGPPPVTMYDLIRAALRARPHGIIIGESRGAEAWELVRAAATGHGYSAFTIHATSAEHVWGRFFQVVQAHPDAQRLQDYQIAQSFAEAVCAVVYVERSPLEGQVIREIAEVSPVIERAAGKPSFNPLFRRLPGHPLNPTGNRPGRPGFRPIELGLPEDFFNRS